MRDVVVTLAEAPDAVSFDAAMRRAFQQPSRVLLEGGVYKSAMLPEWNRNRPDRGFVMNGSIESAGSSKATIMADVGSILDSDITAEPQRLVTGRGVWDDPSEVHDMTNAEGVWRAIPRGQAIRNVRLVLNHSLLLPRWKAAGVSLRTSGVLLFGHNAAIEGVDLIDVGAWRSPSDVAANRGVETFPAAIIGATSAFDVVHIAKLDPATHVYDESGVASHISGCSFDGYVPDASNDQVTVFMIVGSLGERAGWLKGDWQFTWRANAYHEGNRTKATGSNLVQAHTTYLAKRGEIRNNTSDGADIGYYGDYLMTRGQFINQNSFTGCRHGVALMLSPGTAADREIAKFFYHEDYEIGINKIESRGANVAINTISEPTPASPDNWLPLSPTRYIRNIRVHASLSLENIGGEVTRFGEDLNARKGCNPFKR